MESDSKSKAPDRRAADELGQADLLVALATSSAELFHDDKLDAYATVFDAAGVAETMPLGSKQFALWLGHIAHQSLGKAPSSRAKSDATSTLQSIARYGDASGRHGFAANPRVRTGSDAQRFYLDLANANHDVVEVSASGWSLCGNCPVRFRRPRALASLQAPTRGSTIDRLRDFINVDSERDFLLLVSWLVAALRPAGPFPILALVSEQGSGKSTATRHIRRLVDPNSSALRAMPRDERELAIMANNGWLLAFDNISGIGDRMSDAFCRLSTGGGFSVRALFTDSEEAIFDAQRPVIVNGIDDLGTRPDLGERCIVLNLRPIDESARKDERTIHSQFDQVAPGLLGALLDLLVASLALDHVRLDRSPRMADFALLGARVAVARGLEPEEFIEAYRSNALATTSIAIDSDPLPSAINALLARPSHAGKWRGTPTELLVALREVVSDEGTRSKAWPRVANHLGNRLRRLKPSLLTTGIALEERRGRTREWTIERIADGPSSSSTPTPPRVDDDGHDDLLPRANGSGHGYPPEWDTV